MKACAEKAQAFCIFIYLFFHQRYAEFNRVVVGINEVFIQGFNTVEADVGREDHTVNHIILGIGGIGGMIGLVEQPAGRHGQIESKRKPLRETVFLQMSFLSLFILEIRH